MMIEIDIEIDQSFLQPQGGRQDDEETDDRKNVKMG
jgi:hypothetical protein